MSYANLFKAALSAVRNTGEFAGMKATSFDLKAGARIARNRGGLEGMSKFLQGQRLPSGARASDILDDAKNNYFNDEVFSGGQIKLPKGTLGKTAPAVIPKPPFKPSGVGRPAPGASRMAARNAELGMKRKVKAANAAITQQNAMDVAKKAGQITDKEIVKTNKILMRRRKAAQGM